MNLQDIQADYTKRNLELQKVKDKIEMRSKQIERLEKKRVRAQESSHWINMVHQVMEQVAEQTPHINWDLKRSCTTGMRAEYYLFGKTIENEITVGICFTPDQGSNVKFDTGEKVVGYQRGSIGCNNGFDNVSKRLESIQELFILVEKQQQEEIILREEDHRERQLEFKIGDSVVINNRERGIYIKSEPGFCEIFFAGERGNEKVRVYKMRKPNEWEKMNPNEVER